MAGDGRTQHALRVTLEGVRTSLSWATTEATCEAGWRPGRLLWKKEREKRKRRRERRWVLNRRGNRSAPLS